MKVAYIDVVCCFTTLKGSVKTDYHFALKVEMSSQNQVHILSLCYFTLLLLFKQSRFHEFLNTHYTIISNPHSICIDFTSYEIIHMFFFIYVLTIYVIKAAQRSTALLGFVVMCCVVCHFFT